MIQLERTGAMIQIIIVFILFKNVWLKCGCICLLKVKIQLERVFHWITFTGLKHLLCSEKWIKSLDQIMELDLINMEKRIQSKQFQELEKRKQKQLLFSLRSKKTKQNHEIYINIIILNRYCKPLEIGRDWNQFRLMAVRLR